MNEQEVKTLLEQREAEQRKSLGLVIARRKTALGIVINNLVKDIEGMPATAQDVTAIYAEIVSKLYNEYANIK